MSARLTTIEGFGEHVEEAGVPSRDPFLLIPEGQYEVSYVCHDGPKPAFGSDEWRIYVHWQIVTQCEYQGVVLFQSFKHYKIWGAQSKFYRTWTLANGARPRRRTRMSPRIFAGKVFLANVRTVRPKYCNDSLKGKEQSQCMWYSVVDELLEVTAGRSIE